MTFDESDKEYKRLIAVRNDEMMKHNDAISKAYGIRAECKRLENEITIDNKSNM